MWNFKSVISGTLTGVRISAVDGTAFLDNCPDILRHADDKSIIRIFDSAGRYLEAWCKSKGSGETLSATELLLNGSMETNDNWNPAATPVTCKQSNEQAHGGTYSWKLVGNSSYDQIESDAFGSTSSVGALLKTTGYIFGDGTAKVAVQNKFTNVGIFDSPLTAYPASWNEVTLYDTKTRTGYDLIAIYQLTTFGTTYIDDFSVKQVLTPSATGLILRNDAGQQSFSYKNPSFTYNAASYNYKIFTDVRIN